MSVNEFSGQPGNALPLNPGSTSDRYDLDYPIQAIYRRNIVQSSAQAITVSASQSGSIFAYGGNASGVTFTLPSPEPGLWFEFNATGAIASAGTILTCADTTGAFITVGNSGGSDGMAASASTVEFSVAGPGCWLTVLGLSTATYLARQTMSGCSAVPSTGNWQLAC